MTDRRRPIRLAGRTKTGRMIKLIMVICQERKNITMSTRVTLIRLETTDDRVSEKACWAPITSLLSRLMRAPVWVRVKKARGIRWMWSNTWERMSKMSPSPDLGRHPPDADGQAGVDDGHHRRHQRQPDDQPLVVLGMPLLMMERNSSGLITPITASMTTSTRKTTRIFR